MTRRKLFSAVTGALAAVIAVPKKALGFNSRLMECVLGAHNSHDYLARIVTLNDATLPIKLRTGDRLALGWHPDFSLAPAHASATISFSSDKCIFLTGARLPSRDYHDQFFIAAEDIIIQAWSVTGEWGRVAKN